MAPSPHCTRTTSIRSDPVGTVWEDMVKVAASSAKVDIEPTWATSANAVPDHSSKGMPTAIAAMASAHTNGRLVAFGICWFTFVHAQDKSLG